MGIDMEKEKTPILLHAYRKPWKRQNRYNTRYENGNRFLICISTSPLNLHNATKQTANSLARSHIRCIVVEQGPPTLTIVVRLSRLAVRNLRTFR